MIKNLFENLAYFYCWENDLSNITKILCDISPFFKKVFINFFFPDLDVKKVDSIDREIPAPKNRSSRVDLYLTIMDDPLPYLIEVKIGDKNQHFGQYERDYNIPSHRLGYITNYTLVQPGYDIKTWEQFYNHLSKKIKKIKDGLEKELCIGFLHFLKSSCNIIKLDKPMNFNTLQSLYQFFMVLRPLMNIESTEYSMVPSRFYAPAANGLPMGIQLIEFYLTPKGKKKSFYGWISLYYDRETPLITLFLDGANKKVDSLIKNLDLFKSGKTYEKPYADNDERWNRLGVWFDMKKSTFKKFAEATTIEEQNRILQNFIVEISNFIISETSNMD